MKFRSLALRFVKTFGNVHKSFEWWWVIYRHHHLKPNVIRMDAHVGGIFTDIFSAKDVFHLRKSSQVPPHAIIYTMVQLPLEAVIFFWLENWHRPSGHHISHLELMVILSERDILWASARKQRRHQQQRQYHQIDSQQLLLAKRGTGEIFDFFHIPLSTAKK